MKKSWVLETNAMEQVAKLLQQNKCYSGWEYIYIYVSQAIDTTIEKDPKLKLYKNEIFYLFLATLDELILNLSAAYRAYEYLLPKYIKNRCDFLLNHGDTIDNFDAEATIDFVYMLLCTIKPFIMGWIEEEQGDYFESVDTIEAIRTTYNYLQNYYSDKKGFTIDIQKHIQEYVKFIYNKECGTAAYIEEYIKNKSLERIITIRTNSIPVSAIINHLEYVDAKDLDSIERFISSLIIEGFGDPSERNVQIKELKETVIKLKKDYQQSLTPLINQLANLSQHTYTPTNQQPTPPAPHTEELPITTQLAVDPYIKSLVIDITNTYRSKKLACKKLLEKARQGTIDFKDYNNQQKADYVNQILGCTKFSKDDFQRANKDIVLEK